MRIYGALIPSAFHHFLKGTRPLIAIGVMSHDQPIAIVLATMDVDPAYSGYQLIGAAVYQVDIFHLYVAPDYRHQRIGTELVDRVLQAAKKEALPQSMLMLSLVFNLNDPFTGAMEKIVAANHWGGVRPFMLSCRFDVFDFNLPWVNLEYPRGFTEFLWSQLKNEERQELKKLARQNVFGPVSPFQEEENIEYVNSLGVRHQGSVVAWLITHRLPPDTIRYSSIYVERDLPSNVIMPKLLFNAIRLHLKHTTKAGLFEIPLIQVNPWWVKFIEEMLLPYATSVVRKAQAWHIVKSTSE